MPGGSDQLDAGLAPGDVLARLGEPVRQLVIANHVLFKDHWDDLAEDLRRRTAGKPYLFKLDLDLAEPLAWIARLKDYELARGESLAAALSA